ncbi:MAG: AAA family ATPase, partial [Paraglaciecola polaris]|uniref:AAA family ATPase n=1 Tax=Paraglaciecola polaris TaxID=222814 RepID=UPI0030017C4E
SQGGAVFHGVEVDQETLQKINARQHYIIRVEGSDQDAVISTFAKGMMLDVVAKTQLKVPTDLGLERFIVTTDKIDILHPEGKLIVVLIGGSSRFKGIGPVKAQKLWACFGESLYDLLRQGDTETLMQMLTQETARRAVDAWKTYVNIDAMRYCNMMLGLGVSMSVRVTEFYQHETVDKLNEDPYRLLAFGLAFIQCDTIAKQRGFCADADIRLSAAVEAALYQILDSGSTVATHEMLTGPLSRLLAVSDNDTLVTDELISQALQMGYDSENYVLLEDGSYQSNGAFVMESFVAERMVELIRTPVQFSTTINSISDIISDYEQAKGFSLTSRQYDAVMHAFQHRFFIINGGAGVGKTTVLDALYRVFESMHIVPIQLALTGKAAKRMTEATGYESFTIARFVRAFDFKRHEGSELVIVIDESSMVDLPSMFRLLKFTPRGTRIIMLGDTGQLPPVDFGLVFHELIDLDFVPKVTLTEVRRQGKSSNIPSVSNAIRQGVLPQMDHHDVTHIAVSGFTAIKKQVAELYQEAPDTAQIICPTNKMAEAINELCASANKKARMRIYVEDFDRYMDTGFRLGDKVMCCKNLYYMDVMNGSVGVVTKVYKEMVLVSSSEGEEASDIPSFGRILWDDGVEREVSVEMIDALKLAYAMTIHKSQGSQYERVIIPLDRAPNLDRTMFYTAITRAQKVAILVGDLSTLSNALINEASESRLVHLKNKLCVLSK